MSGIYQNLCIKVEIPSSISSVSFQVPLNTKAKTKASTMKVFVVLFFIVAVSANFESRIAGGKKAKAGKITSFVALQIEFDTGIKGCGGLLSSANQVITAANCVFRLKTSWQYLQLVSLPISP